MQMKHLGHEMIQGIKKQFSENLKRLMRRDSITGVMLAKAAGVEGSAAHHWIHGNTWPGDKQLDKLMRAFKWTTEELFGGMVSDSPLSAAIKKHNESDSPFKISLK